MKRIILVVAGAAAAAGLTACGSGAPPAPAAAPASHKSRVRVPVSCSEQYSAWAHGHGKGLIAAVAAVSSAATAGNPQVLTAALKKARPAVSLAARHPVPGCADPRGYWYVAADARERRRRQGQLRIEHASGDERRAAASSTS